LWVDPAVTPDDSSLRLLQTRHRRVDVAASAADAFARLSATVYDLVIVELRLPDTHGLTMLESLRREGRGLRTLVLATSPDVKETVAALRLGAVDVREKPLRPVEVAAAVETALRLASHETETAGDAAAVVDAPGGERDTLARLKRTLSSLSAARCLAADAAPPDARRARLITALAEAIAAPTLSVPSFVACAAALRRAFCVEPQGDLPEAAARVHATLAAATARWRAPRKGKVREAIACLEQRLRRGQRPRQYEVAADVGADPVHLGRLFRADTGLRFSDWKTAYSIRSGLKAVAQTDNLVSQIAYQLGFEHPSQFIREFESLVGVTPREYRRRVCAARDAESLPPQAGRPADGPAGTARSADMVLSRLP
jgi:AraC-like DNA-binding protein/AmiR/NasT family two-component response regulator